MAFGHKECSLPSSPPPLSPPLLHIHKALSHTSYTCTTPKPRSGTLCFPIIELH